MIKSNAFHGKHYTHSLSHRVDFTSSVGHIIPIFWDILYPGDSVHCASEIVTVTEPLVTPARVDIEERIDWVFVPMVQICQFFRDIAYGIQDINSDMPFISQSNLDPTNLRSMFREYFPTITVGNINAFVKSLASATSFLVSDYPELRDTTPMHVAKDVYRFLDGFGYPVFGSNYGSNRVDAQDPTNSLAITPWPLFAYQKYYYDHIRLTDREVNDPTAYNFDAAVLSSTGSTLSDLTNRAKKLFHLRYIPYDLDYFTDNYISPVFSTFAAEKNSLSGNELNLPYFALAHQWLTNVEAQVLNSPNSLGLSVQNTEESYANPAMLRTMFATEKALEITRRAGKHYDKQTLAHFGVKPNEGISGESIVFGHDEGYISIKYVESNADTEGAPLGTLAGKGYGYGKTNRHHKFHTNEHGVLLAVYYSKPKASYYQYGMPRLFTYSRISDFALPSMDGIGAQPLLQYEAGLFHARTSDNNAVIGWVDRWHESKHRYNRIFGRVAGINQRSWVYGRDPFVGTDLWNYIVQPDALDDLFIENYWSSAVLSEDNTSMVNYDSVYEGDPLKHFFTLDIKKSSFMSKNGVPSL